jgi:hypothetical protein
MLTRLALPPHGLATLGGMVRSQPIRPDYAAALRGGDAAFNSLARAALATIQGVRNSSVRSVEYAQKTWPDDPAPAMILRAALQPALTSNPTWAGTFAQVAVAFVDAMVPLSAGAALLQRSLQLSFGGADRISIPGIFMPMADFVAEGAPIPAVQGTPSTQAVVEPTKFAVIVALSRELYESPSAENLIRTAMIESAGPALDRRLFDNAAAVPELRPAGLLNGISATPASALTDMHAAMISDLSALTAAVAQRAGNGDLAFVMAPRQAVAATLDTPKEFPWPLLTSTALADGEVICVVPSAIAAAMESVPRIDANTQTSWHRETNPQPIVSDSGVVSYPVANSFQTDEVVMRMRWPLSWARRANDAIAFITGAKWPAG